MKDRNKRLTRLKRTLARATISAISIIWLTACKSTPTASTPAVTPPDPYTPDGVLVIELVNAGEPFTSEVDGVFLPWWYWEKVFDYIVDTQADAKK